MKKEPVSANYLSYAALVLYIIYTNFTYATTNDGLTDAVVADNSHYAILLAAAIFVFPIEKMFKHGLKASIHADTLLVTSFVYWSLLDIIQSKYPLTIVPPEAVKLTFIYIALFVLFVEIGSQWFFKLPKIAYEASQIEISAKTIFIVIIFCFSVSLYFYWSASYYDFAYMVKSLTRPRFRSPWQRGVAGGFSAIVEHFKYFGYILPSLAVLYWTKVKKFNLVMLFIIFITLFFGAFEFQGGGRRITGFLIGVAGTTYLVYVRNRLNVKHLATMALFAVGVLILLDMQLAFRNKGYENMFQEYKVENLNEIRVDDNFLRIAQLIHWIPQSYPHAGLQYLIYSFGRPIPRFIWSSKPLDPGYDVAYMAGEVGVTLTTTVVGEAYASGGVVMLIIMGIFYGMISGTMTKLLNNNLGTLGFSLYALATLALVGGVRALVDLIVFSYAFLGLLVLYKYWIRKRAYFEYNPV